MNVLLTGAGGFIGQHLQLMLQMRGHRVRTVRRRAGKDRQYRQDNKSGHYLLPDSLQIDIQPHTDWKEAFRSIDVIIHLADGLRAFESLRHRPAPETEREAIARTGNLARAAGQTGIRMMLYASSVKAVSGECAENILTEESFPDPERSPYGILKKHIEEELEETASRYAMDMVILRPPLVYGPGSRGNFSRLLQLADTPWPLPFGNFTAPRSMIYVENLCHAFCKAFETSLAVNRTGQGQDRHFTYFVQDGAPRSVAEILTTARRLAGQPPRLFPWPGLPVVTRFPVLRPVLERLAKPLVVDDRAFRQEFFWTPPCTFEKSLHKTICSLMTDGTENCSV